MAASLAVIAQIQLHDTPITPLMNLLNLPTEILRDIVNFSRPDGFENLSRTCRLVFDIAEPLIEEHNRYKAYSASDLAEDTLSYSQVFYDVLKHPLKARYVTYLRYWRHPDPDLESYPPEPGQDVADKLRHFLNQSACIIDRVMSSMQADGSPQTGVPDDLTYWHRGLMAAYPEFLPSALLLLLPNLKSINFKNICLVAGTYLESVLNVLAQDAIAYKAHSLSHIRIVYIVEDDGVDFQCLAPFLALPSLKKLVGQFLEADTLHPNYRWPYGSWPSNVEQIEMSRSAIGASQLRQILRPMSHLRVFKYHHRHIDADAGSPWDAAGILRSLVHCVASTLEELSLSSAQPSAAALKSFMDLKKLTKLELSISLLLNMEENQDQD